MLERISHRGPDGEGIVIDRHIGLGHVRLSILDLSDRAAQPMSSRNGRYRIVYNGEVYNFSEMRASLAAIGVTPRSSGDTEVLLEHLASFGLEKTLTRIEGFFAFALWDSAMSKLTLARDRLGIKPLYWSVRDGQVRFASECKALVDGRTDVDVTSLDAMLLGFPLTWGAPTAYRGVSAVEPGTVVEFERSATAVTRRWFSVGELVDRGLRSELDQMGADEVVDLASDALRTSLQHRLVSDVPVASLVSGGVDSSLITALVYDLNARAALYHADVVEDSERASAEMVAESVATQLKAVEVTDELFMRSLAEATWFNDQPLTYHVNAVPFFSVCKFAGRDGVKVLLSGEGSDELFLGYPQYGLAPYIDVVESMKLRIRRLMSSAMPRVVRTLWPRAEETYARYLRDLVTRGETAVLDADSDLTAADLGSWRERRVHSACMALAQSHLASLLHRNDRLGMAAGIENRFPFLGNDIVRIALNLPARYKLRWVTRLHDSRHPFISDKWVVRRVAEQYLPVELARRTKQGFPVRVENRVVVRPEMLVGGFVSEQWQLSDRAMHEMVERAPSSWLLRLALVEVWGRLFFYNDPVDAVSSHFVDNSRVAGQL